MYIPKLDSLATQVNDKNTVDELIIMVLGFLIKAINSEIHQGNLLVHYILDNK